jgi:RNA polymerase sigma factor (sigma-70 family)
LKFCANSIEALLARHGDAAMRRPEYRRLSALRGELRNVIASDNLGLVYDLYKKNRTCHPDGDELLSEGMMALTRAIDTFNPYRGFRFSTYACSAIVRAFYRCSLEQVKRHRREPVYFDAQSQKSDWVDTRRTEESTLYTERLAKILDDDSAGLTTTEKAVLRRRFPLDAGKDRTLAEIGGEMGLSKERVRQLQNSALAKLRRALDADPLLTPTASLTA